jgi:HD-like signal output (HDOD) protein
VRRILFVDGEPNILQGLRRLLRDMRHEWEMEFAGSGRDALEILRANPCEIVVSDVKMSGVDGGDLLVEVQSRYPETIRIVLSGNPDKNLLFTSIGATHQYLSKPCDPDQLKEIINRSLALRTLLQSEAVIKLASRLTTIPSLPTLYRQVIDELKNPNCSLQQVGQVIAQDIGMSAKVLKLVNSAYFGLPNPIANVERAVTFLGLETSQSLVLGIQIFAEYEGRSLRGFSIDELWKHSLRTAFCARALAKAEGLGRHAVDDVFMAAMLHDVGKLVLAANLPRDYERYVVARDESADGADVEREIFGASHAEVGAYILGLWGLPDFILESIVFQSNPIPLSRENLDPRSVVHLADVLVMEHDGSGGGELSWELSALGSEERGAAWRAVCAAALVEKRS